MAAITLNFDSFKEMKDFAKELIGGNNAEPVKVSESRGAKDTKPVTEKMIPEETAEIAETPEEETTEAEGEAEVTYTLEDVRAKLAALNKAGKREAVQALIASYGAGKLTEVKESNYADLMQKAGEL